MLRTFAEHDVRVAEPLDGVWEFVTAPERTDRARLPKSYTRKMHVPSAWELTPRLESYRGKAWYRKLIGAVDGMAVRLVFGGVSHTADVYLDGKHVGHHYDAFTPFEIVVPGLASGAHELVVEVDNTFGDHSALHIPNDYYTYGGITRPVELQFLPEIYVAHLRATPRRQGKRWSLDLAVELSNWSDTRATRRLLVRVGATTVDLGRVSVGPRATRVHKTTLDDLDVQPWSPPSPTLYFVEASLLGDDIPVDDLCDRIGFREVQVAGKRLLLNGKSIRPHGYNRHEDHPQFGCAIPVEAMARDLAILRDLNCDFVRTCHYPNDMRFLDLCDELGFYVWEESHARTVDCKHPRFREQIRTSTEEMVRWHHNRPSIIMWGCLNECDTTSRPGHAEHKRVLQLLKKLDPSRPVTYAANRRKADTCARYADIISWNFYVGWYSQTPEDTAAFLADMLTWKNSPTSKGGAGKPVILSEFGAGGIYGCRNPNAAHWTEEYQCHVLDENLKVYLHHPEVVGVAIWQFCDCRITEEGSFWGGRPRTMNNKGTVDEHRRPKLCYELVKRHMAAAARKYA